MAFLTAEWRRLLMYNVEVDPALLAAPRGTELDLFRGKAYASLVGFMFLRTRVLGVPIPFHVNFEELNLRYYVRREVNGEVRRAVCFAKEIVPRFAIAAVARLVYGENYVAHPMRHRDDGSEVAYDWWACGRWNTLAGHGVGELASPAPGSEEEFIAEHYWGYAAQRGGGTVEYRVEHPPWRVARVRDATLEADLEQLYGPALGSALRRAPSSVFLAEGSAVSVLKGVPVA